MPVETSTRVMLCALAVKFAVMAFGLPCGTRTITPRTFGGARGPDDRPTPSDGSVTELQDAMSLWFGHRTRKMGYSATWPYHASTQPRVARSPDHWRWSGSAGRC